MASSTARSPATLRIVAGACLAAVLALLPLASAGYAMSSHVSRSSASVMVQGTGHEQRWTRNTTAFPSDWISSGYDDNLYITSVQGGSDGLVVVMDNVYTSSYKGQAWKWDVEFPSQWIQDQYSKQYFITHVTYWSGFEGGVWVVVMTQDATMRKQEWTKNSTIPENLINSRLQDGAVISCAAFSPDATEWVFVMSVHAEPLAQRWVYQSAFPTDIVQQEYANGKVITALTAGTTDSTSVYLVVMTKAPSSFYLQLYYYGEDKFPSQTVHEHWPKENSYPDAGMWISSMGRGTSDSDDSYAVVLTSLVAPPTTFDARTHWNVCLDVLNQEQCGSCWAFALTESLSSRLYLSGETSTQVELSPQALLSCDTSNTGCDGGYENYGWDWLISHGVTTCTNLCTSGCDPYVSGNCVEGKDPNHDGCVACQDTTCSDGSPWPYTYKAAAFAPVFNTPENIQSQLLTNGPVSTCFTVYSNFMTFFNEYPDGVYNVTSGSNVGGHCVLIIGFGEEDSMPYWLVKNSWGADWGDRGYFRIKRGGDVAGLEGGVVAGYTATQAGPAPALSSHRASKGFVGVVGVDSTALATTSSPLPPSGGMWVSRSTDDEDVAVALEAAAALHPSCSDVSNIVSIESQVVAGVKYRLHLRDSTTVAVAVDAVTGQFSIA